MKLGKFLSEYSPEILTGVGIAGFISSTVLAVQSTPKAINLIEEKKQELGVDKLTFIQTVKTAGKCYIPSIVMSITAGGCIFTATQKYTKRCAVLGAAYGLEEAMFTNYREKVKEAIGEKKEEEIRQEVAEDTLRSRPCPIEPVLGSNEYLFLDEASGRYFTSNMERVLRICKDLSLRMVSENWIPLNDFYYEVGLPPISLGNGLGWNLDDGEIDPHTVTGTASNGAPCHVLSFRVRPRFDYRNLY